MASAIGIIPARWDSSRFPGKPLHQIAGKPLLQYVWERSRRARTLDAIVIATDDMRIAEAAFNWGAEVTLTSRRHRSGTDRVAEVAEKWPASYVVNIQGDEPLVDPRLIDRIVNLFRRERKVQMITAAHRFEDENDAASEHQVKVVLDRNEDALYFSRGPIPSHRGYASARYHLRHQGIYGFRRDFLRRFVQWKPGPLELAESLEQLRALENGVKIRVVVTGGGSPGVDTLEDAERMERQLLSGRRLVAKRKPLAHA